MFNFRFLLALLLPGVIFCWCSTVSAQRDFRRDNIVFVFVDDLGYGDMNAKRMPKLTELSSRLGTSIDNFIVHQNCTPSRVAFLTGNDPARVNMYANFPIPIRTGIPAENELISERLKKLGYSTCLVGKWGVGRAYSETAPENGFDEVLQNARINNVPYGTNEFSDIYQTDAAIKFLERAEEPQFLYAALESPHQKYRAPRAYFEKNRKEFGITDAEEKKYLVEKFGIVDIKSTKIPKDVRSRIDRCLYYSMVNVLDDQVARLYQAIESQGKADRTLFMFVSDNGGIRDIADNGIYRSGKDYIYDGGHRACNAIIWPGVVTRHQEIHSNVWIGDMYSTFAQIAGEINPGIGMDGGSIMPAILHNLEVRRGVRNNSHSLVAHIGKTRKRPDDDVLHGEFAVWRFQSKYIRMTTFSLNGKVLDTREELYDLNSDPGEKTNLAKSKGHQQLLVELREEYSNWGGDQRVMSLAVDDHATDHSDFVMPESWKKRRKKIVSEVWP